VDATQRMVDWLAKYTQVVPGGIAAKP
jgi:hypothetical protein